MQNLNIFCNFALDDDARALLEREASAHSLTIGGEPDWDTIDVAFGQPSAEAVMSSQRLKWIQVSSAGITRYDTDEVREALQERGAVLSNSSHVFDEPCAEHVLAMMLALSRALLPCYESQLRHRDWQDTKRRTESFLLKNQSVLILGFGAIAKRLAELLAPFGVRVSAVRRHPEPFPGVQVLGEENVEEALSSADFVVSTLPDSPSTQRYMDASKFGAMKAGAIFVNIGRGATVDQDALLQVLESGHLRAAYLDVTSPEPLPSDHALWTAPNCFITPHTGGGYEGEQSDVVRHFVKNLRRYEAGEELENRVF